MKNRATVLCIQDGKILLVARERAHWALPGGRIKRTEPPEAAARRELEEETGLSVSQISYYFQFQGFSTLHHVFVASLPANAVPEPLNEIARCRWFAPSKIASLSASVPTRGIVDLFVRRIANASGLVPCAF
ncbi:MutT/nudix family protein (plasmid) [Paraburkholderia caribensis MBA4]|uniref:MutT/nudix family protein n=1 Tax=Paraburkholderia caribensis MBA4 TaxID=1323664 RepID=A0A0P0RMQ3_9BURK|nr:NUDIX hydrolase [Paraburkholderia caribensis]ALL70155.1 MutT/nudix family protein [Paraburkholderia caribensis MBA4]